MDLLQEQINIEKEMTANAVNRYELVDNKAKLNGLIGETPAGSALIKKLLAPLTEAIKSYLNDYGEGKAVRATKAAILMSKIATPEVIAFITLKMAVNCCIKEKVKTQNFYLAIGNALEAEFKMQKCRELNNKYYQSIQKDLNSRSCKNARRKKITLGVFNKKLKYHTESFNVKDKAKIGLVLTDLLVRTTGIIEIETFKNKKRTLQYVYPAQVMIDTLEKYKDFLKSLNPVFLPMVTPPKPWTDVFEGGYISPYVQKNSVVKTYDKAYLKQLHSAEFAPAVYKAVNILQATPWQINKKVLATVETLWDKGGNLAGLPSREDEALPLFPLIGKDRGEQLTEAEAEQVKEWKLQTYLTHKKNVAMRSNRVQTSIILDLARRFSDYEAIYFPHQLDFRGRLYPIPALLNPQGSDLAKGLLQFHEGKKVDENSIKWLEIHGANCYGYDKVSYDERIQWVRGHIQAIKTIAINPCLNNDWLRADKPLQFLGFCFEYADFIDNPDNFVTHLPVRLDGTCNGLQHYSALLRDVEGAKAVNLINSPKPSDIYSVVADKLAANLKTLPHSTARNWLSLGINRKLTKRPVMVLPYGGTLLSCRTYIQAYLEENYSLEFLQQIFNLDKNPKENVFKVANWLAPYLWEAIKNTVHSAIIGMDYLKSLARLVNKHKKALEWVTPIGFPVKQAYKKRSKVYIGTETAGSIKRSTLLLDTDLTDKQRQINAICPNYIHSLDGACLMNYLIKAEQAGIKSFTSIHDCYGVLASDTELSAKLLREAFVQVYRAPLLDDFEYDLTEGLEIPPAELPEKPAAGGLDINEVLKSTYFFN